MRTASEDPLIEGVPAHVELMAPVEPRERVVKGGELV